MFPAATPTVAGGSDADMAKANPKGNAQSGEVTQGLRIFVAETYAMVAKTQACHWNMTGPGFIGLHKLTEEQYRELFTAADELAERARALNVEAPHGLTEIRELSSIEDAPIALTTQEAARLLAEDNSAIAERAAALAEAADEADDLATHDMLVARIQVHQKAAWLLRSHLD